MSTSIVHSKILSSRQYDESEFEVTTDLDEKGGFEEYYRTKLLVPTTNLCREISNEVSREVLTKNLNPLSWYITRFYELINYTGKCFSLNNLTSTFVYDPNLSDNNINDKISSINCGRAIICVLIAQHSWFRGARTWLVGKTASGEGPSKKDLTKLPCPAGGSWNDRISSVAAFTVDPVTAAKLLLGILL